MKPFDLERALKGDPVVTANGDEVTQLTFFGGVENPYQLRGVICGALHAWDLKGYSPSRSVPRDLYMAPKKVYINIYKVNEGTKWETEGPYDQPGHKRMGRNYVARDVEVVL